MRTAHIAPGLILDETLYEAAAAGLAHAPDLPPLTWERWTDPDTWFLIPDLDGELSKAETTFTNTPQQTIRMNVWFRRDLRDLGPHNHPWNSFTSHILAGGYTENRWWLDQGGIQEALGVQHVSPGANTVPHDLYHEVAEIHEPGRTLSLMVCSTGRRGDWGYLDLDCGRHISTTPDPGFAERFAALNPHRGR